MSKQTYIIALLGFFIISISSFISFFFYVYSSNANYAAVSQISLVSATSKKLPSITYNDSTLYLSPIENNINNVTWGCNGIVKGATSFTDGSKNTTIAAGCSAAKVCENLVYGGYSDWYLPALSQMTEIFNQRNSINVGDYVTLFKPIANQDYFSSTENNSTTAWSVAVSGTVSTSALVKKTGGIKRIRCVRSSLPVVDATPTTITDDFSTPVATSTVIVESNIVGWDVLPAIAEEVNVPESTTFSAHNASTISTGTVALKKLPSIITSFGGTLYISPIENNINNVSWGCYGTYKGADSHFNGLENTIKAAGCSAAKVCSNLVFGGYDDWYLPADLELSQMYIQNNNINFGDYASQFKPLLWSKGYISSTEYGAYGAMYSIYDMYGYSGRSATKKLGNKRIRCVRTPAPVIDATSPIITSFVIPSTATSTTVSISSFTATDNVAVTGYKLTESSSAPFTSDSGWATVAPKSYTFSSIGLKTLYAWVRDLAGNINQVPQNATVSISDTIPPVVTAFVIPYISSSTTIDISAFTAVDNDTVAGYLLTESATIPLSKMSDWTSTPPISYTFSDIGDNTLYVWVKDTAGNVSEALPGIPVSVGNTGPSIVADPSGKGFDFSSPVGGRIATTTDGNNVPYIFNVFNTPGTFTLDVPATMKVDMLMVGGGGGGGGGDGIGIYSGNGFMGAGGGGGAGGLVYLKDYLLNKGTYSVKIGAGGNGGTLISPGTNGGDTTFGPVYTQIVAYGGGGGGSKGSPNGSNGGSGGGAGSSGHGTTAPIGGIRPGTGIPGQGFSGGTNMIGSYVEFLGGGGGGSGGPGLRAFADSKYSGLGGMATGTGRYFVVDPILNSTSSQGVPGNWGFIGFSNYVNPDLYMFSSVAKVNFATGGSAASPLRPEPRWNGDITPFVQTGGATPAGHDAAAGSGNGGGANSYTETSGHKGGSGTLIIRYKRPCEIIIADGYDNPPAYRFSKAVKSLSAVTGKSIAFQTLTQSSNANTIRADLKTALNNINADPKRTGDILVVTHSIASISAFLARTGELLSSRNQNTGSLVTWQLYDPPYGMFHPPNWWPESWAVNGAAIRQAHDAYPSIEISSEMIPWSIDGNRRFLWPESLGSVEAAFNASQDVEHSTFTESKLSQTTDWINAHCQ